MSYTITFTDPAKTNDALVIDDNIIDSRLSVSFVGKNASNYSTAISTNFLHLLENFANTEPPAGLSVQGQLWYDTSNPDIPVLRISNPAAGNGSPTSWAPASGIWAQSTTPGTDATYGGAKAGDIWVNTAQGQLYINTDGTNNWTLVGPSFSGTLQTGSFPEIVNDNFGAPHYVIKNYVNGTVVEIISGDSFIPQSRITGFTNILAGLNLNSTNNISINATSYAAKNLLVTSPSTSYISANNFVRNDIDNSITAILTVQNGVLMGTDKTFNLRINPSSAREAQIINSYNGGVITLSVYTNTQLSTLLRIDGATKSVGIGIGNNPPGVSTNGLHVGGNIRVDGVLNVNASSRSTFAGDLAVVGNILNTGTITAGDDLTVGGQLYVNWNNGATGPAILPGTSGNPVTETFDIGSPTAKFRNIYANTFQGSLIGTAVAANSLTNASAFAVLGDVATAVDVSYKGVQGTYRFTTTVQKSVISGRTTSTNTSTNNWTSFYSNANNGQFTILGLEASGTATITTNLVQIEKKNFLADIYANLIPTGSIIPFAGSAAPTGWLLCDGQSVYKSQYQALFQAIGWTYGALLSNSNVFKLPDLRGRGVIGYDDMNNGTLGLSNAGRVASAIAPDGTDGSAALVSGGNATVVVSTGTVSTGTGAKSVVSNATSLNVMNPYLAMNYIIKT
jgi:microcystin-dependent protein